MIKFIHQPRTGGTYLNYLAGHNGIEFMGGHFIKMDSGDGCLYMTTLRQPLERVVSYLRYIWHIEYKRDWYLKAIGETMPDAFPERGWRDFEQVKELDSMELNNAVCCRMAGHDVFGESTYAMAIANLERLDCVSLFEDWPSVIAGLEALAGQAIEVPTDISRNASKDIPYRFTPDDLDWIRRHNEADQALYGHAATRLL